MCNPFPREKKKHSPYIRSKSVTPWGWWVSIVPGVSWESHDVIKREREIKGTKKYASSMIWLRTIKWANAELNAVGWASRWRSKRKQSFKKRKARPSDVLNRHITIGDTVQSWFNLLPELVSNAIAAPRPHWSGDLAGAGDWTRID